MNKHTHSLGTIEDLRASGKKSAVSFKNLSAEKRVVMVGTILEHFHYKHLSREDKGLVRQFLQQSTGYSRAQITRHITQHLHRSQIVGSKRDASVIPTLRRLTWPACVALIMLLLAHITGPIQGDVLHVLNAERTQEMEGFIRAPARIMSISTVAMTGANAMMMPLLSVHEEQGETLVAWSLHDLLRRVNARRIARLRLQGSHDAPRGQMTARPGIVEKEAFPPYPTREQMNMHAAATDPWDIPARGIDGQILIIKNGKPVWHDFPYLEQIRSAAPHGNEPTRRVGGNRSGGSGDSSTTTTTTTIVQGGSSDPSGWTDGTGIVYLTDGTDSVGIGTDTPSTTLEVAGSISGASLYITSSMSGAGLTDCDAGTSKLIYDAATGRFACATDQTVGTGLSQTTGDERYLQKQGGTMTGVLTINITGGNRNTVGLNVINTISGAVIHAEQSLTSSGTLTFEGAASGSSLYIATSIQGAGLTDCDAASQTLAWDATSGRFSCGTDLDTNTTYTAAQGLTLNGTAFSLNSTITGALVRFTTLSGSTVYAKSALNASGSLSVDGTAYFNAAAPLKITDAGFYGCTALETDADGDIVCGSDGGGSSYTAGQGIGLNGTVFSLNATITGSLVSFTTISGSVIKAANTLTSSGSLTWEGAASGSSLWVSTFEGAGLTDCDAASSVLQWNDSTGRFSCTTISAGTTYTAGQGLVLAGASFRLSPTITGSLVNFHTVSGSVITAKTSLASSGTFVFEGAASGASLWVSTFEGAGLTDCDASTGKVIWDDTLNRFSCSTDLNTGTTYTAGQNLTLTGNAFSLNTTVTGALVRFNTVSGSLIYAKTALASSGTLVFEGAASGSSLWVSTFEGAGLSDCDASTNKIVWDETAKRFSCSTDLNTGSSYTAGQNLTLTGNAFSLNSTITGALVRFTTISGSTVFARNTLTSSGTLVTESGAIFDGGTLYVDASGNRVGIGTANPSQALDIVGTVNTSTSYRLNVNTILNYSGTVPRFGDSGGWTGVAIYGGSNEVVRVTDSGRVGIGTTGPKAVLDVVGTVSGSSLTLSSLRNCDTIDTDANGNLICGADAGAAGGNEVGTITFTGAVIRLADVRYVKKQGDTMTGALAINITGGNRNTIGLNVLNTISGSVIHAQNSLTSSGTLVFEGAASGSSLYIATSIQGAGLTDCDLSTQTLAWDATTGRFSCGTDSDTTYTAGRGLGLNGTSFSLNSTITGSLVSFTTVSGSVINAKNTLTSSGSLTWEGAASGATLYVATSINGAGLVDCDIAGTSKLLWDSTTGRFSCGTDTDTDTNTTYTAGRGTGLTGTSFSLNDTITGALVRFTTVSGSTIYAKSALNASGSLSVDGTAYFNAAAPLKITDAGFYGCTALETDADGDIVCGSDTDTNTTYTAGEGLTLTATSFSLGDSISGSLLEFATVSGSVVTANTLRSSGSLVFEGAASGSSLYIATSLQGVGLTDCDATSQTLNWDAATGRFSCGTDSDTTYQAAQGLSLNGTAFSLNSTITGALVRFTTISGSSITAKTSLASSGSLTWEGAGSGSSLYIASSLQGVGLVDCDIAGTSKLLWDSTTGRFSCGTDTDTDTNTTYTAAQGLTLNGTAFSLNSTITGALVRFNTISGSTVYAKNSLASSGSLTWEGSASGASLWVSTFEGAGLTDCDLSTSKIIWDSTAKRFSCATDLNTTAWSNTGSLQSSFDARYVNVSGDTMTGTLVLQPASGLALNARGTISGALITQNGAGNNYFLGNVGIGTTSPGAKLDVNGVAYIRDRLFVGGGSTNDIGGYWWDTSLTFLVADSGGSYSEKLRITPSGNVGINKTSPSTKLDVAGTISGSTLYAATSLRSSGSLVFEGAGSGSSLYIASSLQGAGLSDCDIAGSSKLLWDATTGRFSCGTDQTGGSSFGTGNVLTIGDSRYVNTSGDTMTGALTLTGADLILSNNGTLGRLTRSAFNNTLSLYNSVITPGSVTPGPAVNFDGTNDYIDVGNIGTRPTAGAISFWMKADTIADYRNPFTTAPLTQNPGGNAGIRFDTAANGSLVAVVGDDSGNPTVHTYLSSGLATSTWYHVALLWDSSSSNVKGYLNGVQKFDASNTTWATNFGDVKIGTGYGDSLRYWDGLIDDVRIYDVALSESDVLAVYNNGAGTVDQVANSILGWWRLDEGTGTSAVDASGNGNNGTLNGAGWGTGIVPDSVEARTEKLALSFKDGGSLNEAGILTLGNGEGRVTIDASHIRMLTNGMDRIRITSGGLVGIGTVTPKAKLDVVGTISGSTLYAATSLRSSGSLVFEGAGSGSSLYIASSLQGAGLSDCDIAGTSKLLWDATTGRFSCGTDQTGGSSFGTGNVLTIGDSRYVNVGGDTMTGALTVNVTSGTINTIGLKVINTLSGAIVQATKQLRSSGTLVVEGDAAIDGTTFAVDSVNNRVGIGTASPSTNLHVYAPVAGNAVSLVEASTNGYSAIYQLKAGPSSVTWQMLTQEDFLSNSLLFRNGGTTLLTLQTDGDVGIGTTVPKAKLDVVGTASGSKLFASTSLASSGMLVITSRLKAGSGAATFVPAAFQTGAYISGSGAAALALDTYTNTGSRTPHILFGYRGTFDTGLYRVGAQNSGALALRVANTFSNNAASAFEIYSNAEHVNNKVFRVATNGATFSDGAYASTGADYAEWFMSKDKLLPGEVVCIDVTKKNSVKRCTNAADGNVMGIVSTNPSFVGNSIGGAEGIMPPGYVLVGLIGQVPAKVIVEGSSGAIRPGDSLTPASIAGYARKAKAGESTVGVALEGLTSGQGVVNVLISRRNQSLTVEAVEEKVLKTIASMEIDDEVELMVSSALGNLNVDEQITAEVTRQIEVITAQNASIQELALDIARLEDLIVALQAQSGTSFQPLASGSGWLEAGGHLAAATLELEDTLTTGGSARIGGDLSIDGTLNASSLFVPNGLTIDGGVVMQGLLDTQEIHVSSGATIDGTLTINGTLNLASGATLNLGSGALTISQLIVENALFVMGDITIKGMATFLGDINVKGELIVSNKQAGFAMIPKNGTSVTITFGSGFKATPVVSVTPNDFVFTAWRTAPVTQTGFTIELAGPADRDVTFSWIALGVSNPIMLNAELTDDGTIIFPLASDNIPVSSNMVWNACIRNITMLDESGQPLSCARYHDAYTWTQPDLQISFVWNTSVTPALLKLPDGYEARVTENAQGILDAINGTEDGEDVEDLEETGTRSTMGSDIGDLGSGTTDEPVTEENPIVEEQPVIEEVPVIEEEPTQEPETIPAEEPAPAEGGEEVPAEGTVQ